MTKEKRSYTRKTDFLFPHEIQRVLERLNLPRSLHALIKAGTLLETLEELERRTDAINEALDAWEGANPAMAVQAPWYEARQQWKAQGRPRADWWQLLKGLDDPYIANALNEVYPVRERFAKKALQKRRTLRQAQKNPAAAGFA